MSENHPQHEHHITPLSTYLKVWVTLLTFTIITVLVAQFNFGVFNTLIAMAIATFKVWLVLAYFMGLKYEGMLNRATIASSLIFALIFFSLTGMDVFTRGNMTRLNDIQRPAPDTTVSPEGKTLTAPTPKNIEH